MSKQYAWSTDEEMYHGKFDTVEEALAEAREHLIDGLDEDPGSYTVWVGEAKPIPTGRLVDAECIVERMQERAYEEVGEFGEDYLTTATAEQLKELEALVVAWADRVEMPSFYSADNILAHTIVIPGEAKP